MISSAAIALILSSEGLDQPGKWPKGKSGITIGHGYDLGYTPVGEFLLDWAPHLDDATMGRLRKAIGLTGPAAERLAPSLADIKITQSAAQGVFQKATLPKWELITRKTFPGVELLPADVLGALTSLVFNRGTSMEGQSRREMLRIRDSILGWSKLSPFARIAGMRPLQLSIAGQIRSMKRIWIGMNLTGLLTRREAEAQMVENAKPDPH